MPKVKLLEAEGDGGGHSGMNSIFTPEELAEIAAADAQIEAEFELTLEERREIQRRRERLAQVVREIQLNHARRMLALEAEQKIAPPSV